MTTNIAYQTSPANQISLLAYLAYKFGGQTETIATEALGYILSRSEAARNALRDMIGIGGVDVGRIARVATEVQIEVEGKEARVDLVGFDAGDAERAFIEVKFWAGLTENQPNTYLERLLQNTEPSALLFVAPESRMATLWAELRRLASDGGFALGNGTQAAGLQSAVVNNGIHRLVITSWRALLDSMASRASIDGDSSAERGILELNGLCDQQDTEAFLPIRAGEFGLDFPRRIRDLWRLIEDAPQSASDQGFASVRGLNRHVGFGRNLRLGSVQKDVRAYTWFGVNNDFKNSFENYPLVLRFYEEKYDRGAMPLAEVKRRLGYQIIPVALRHGEEYDAVRDAVVKDLRWYARRLSGEVDDAEWRKKWPGNLPPRR